MSGSTKTSFWDKVVAFQSEPTEELEALMPEEAPQRSPSGRIQLPVPLVRVGPLESTVEVGESPLPRGAGDDRLGPADAAQLNQLRDELYWRQAAVEKAEREVGQLIDQRVGAALAVPRAELIAEKAELERQLQQLDDRIAAELSSLLADARVGIGEEREQLSAERAALAEERAAIASERRSLAGQLQRFRQRVDRAVDDLREVACAQLERDRQVLAEDRGHLKADRVALGAERAELKQARQQLELDLDGQKTALRLQLDGERKALQAAQRKLASKVQEGVDERMRAVERARQLEQMQLEVRKAALENARREVEASVEERVADLRAEMSREILKLETAREQLEAELQARVAAVVGERETALQAGLAELSEGRAALAKQQSLLKRQRGALLEERDFLLGERQDFEGTVRKRLDRELETSSQNLGKGWETLKVRQDQLKDSARNLNKNLITYTERRNRLLARESAFKDQLRAFKVDPNGLVNQLPPLDPEASGESAAAVC